MRRLIAPLMAAFVVGCQAETFSPSATYHVQIVSGLFDTLVAPNEVIGPLVLRVVDEQGAPVGGHEVTVAVSAGGGAAQLSAERTTRDGSVALTWTAGPLPGPQRVAIMPIGGEAFSLTTESTGFNATALAVGQAMACAIDFDQRAWCWGDGWRDGVGRGDSGIDVKPDWRPVPVSGGHHFWAVAAGQDAACGLDLSGAAWCWGADDNGQLGQGATVAGRCFGTLPCSQFPVPVTGGHTFVKIVSAGPTTCAIDGAGAVWCWGENERGQGGLGGGSALALYTPARALTTDSAVDLVAGEYTFCALYAAGTVECWGVNSQGEVGNPVGSAVWTPIPPQTTERFNAIFASTNGFCGRRSDNAVWCWGNILGSGSVPAHQAALDGSSAIGGNWFSDAWTLDQFGRLRLLFGSSSMDISGGVRLTSVGSGAETGCGLGAGGQVWCWGANSEGELGNATQFQWYDAYTYPAVPVGGWYPLP
jgi:hypothetical protein